MYVARKYYDFPEFDDIADFVFSGCKALKRVVIPEGVTQIGMSAFQQCEALSSVTIPSSVTKILYCAFDECRSLTEIHFNGLREQALKLFPLAFRDVPGFPKVHLILE